MTNESDKKKTDEHKDDIPNDFTTIRRSDKQEWICQIFGKICFSYIEYIQHYNTH